MAGGVREFMEGWVEDNIRPEGFAALEDGDPRPAELAKACLVDAEEEGFTRADIEAEVGDLTACMARAIDRATAAEIGRLAEKDN